MVIACGGWSDAGEAATGVITHLLTTLEGGELIAEIDSEDFYDFQVNRPIVLIDDSMVRSLTWPGLQVFGIFEVTKIKYVVTYSGHNYLSFS
jgi:hypothetical protein